MSETAPDASGDFPNDTLDARLLDPNIEHYLKIALGQVVVPWAVPRLPDYGDEAPLLPGGNAQL